MAIYDQIAKFGYLAINGHGQIAYKCGHDGYPWKEHTAYRLLVKKLGVKSYSQNGEMLGCVLNDHNVRNDHNVANDHSVGNYYNLGMTTIWKMSDMWEIMKMWKLLKYGK